MKLLVVTVNYCSAEHVLRSMEGVARELEAIGDAELWIVDNASPDGSGRTIEEAIATRNLGARVHLIASPVNGGFGAGNNVAIRRALALPDPPEFFYLLNPDANPAPGAIQNLLDCLEQRPEVGIAGGRLIAPDGSPQSSTFRFPSLASEIEGSLRFGPVTRLLAKRTVYMMPPPAADSAVDWVSGSSMMIRRSALERAGSFDEGYFLYFEELDLCRRVREQGFEIRFVHDAVVTHVQGVTTGVGLRTARVPGYWFASRARYLRKFHGAVGLWLCNATVIACFSLHRCRQFLLRRHMDPPHYLRDFLHHNLLPKRSPPRATAQ